MSIDDVWKDSPLMYWQGRYMADHSCQPYHYAWIRTIGDGEHKIGEYVTMATSSISTDQLYKDHIREMRQKTDYIFWSGPLHTDPARIKYLYKMKRN